MKHIKIFEEQINEADKQKALLVFVYRAGHGTDTTNKGLTSKVDEVMLVGDGVEGPFSPKDGEDYLVLVKSKPAGREYIKAVPKSLLDSKEWTMFGGNFVYSSDSRFNVLNNGAPIPVHDRVERPIQRND